MGLLCENHELPLQLDDRAFMRRLRAQQSVAGNMCLLQATHTTDNVYTLLGGPRSREVVLCPRHARGAAYFGFNVRRLR